MASEDPLIINEAQLILAEKRTSLSTLRTGIAVMALPMTVLSFLVAASRYYHPSKVLGLLIPLVVLCVALSGLGVYLVVRAVLKLRHADQVLAQLKSRHSLLREFIA
ncbi:MAG: hypothetical protein LDL07_07325 [Desulfarculus sp.]|nr:hypothetical protein [Desulfarculus sp.]